MSHHDDAVDGVTKSFVQIDQATAFRLARELEPSDFKVFFFLTLRAYGWDDKARRVGDGVTRASGSFVAKGTGLSEATSERCLAALKEKGLISKHHHSCKWGNTYCVSPALLRQGPGEDAQPEDKKRRKQASTPEPTQSEVPLPEPEQVASEVSQVAPLQVEIPQIEGTKIEAPQNEATSSLKIRVLGASNLGTNTDSRYSDLSLTLSETFESYFSKIRSPMAEKKERDCFTQIQKRNPDVTEEEFLECFSLVSKAKDSKGKPIAMRFLWMANGFDTILIDARKRIRSRKREAEDRLQAEKKTQEQVQHEQQYSPEDAERMKTMIRSLFGAASSKPNVAPPKPESVQERRAFLLAQARQLGMLTEAQNPYSATV